MTADVQLALGLGLPGEAERDLALVRVEQGATDDERELVEAALDLVIARGGEFTSDDVWSALDAIAPGFTVREPRLLGAVIRSAAKADRIRRTDRVRESIRPAHHRYPCRIWRVDR